MGFWYPYHWGDMSEALRAKGTVDDLGGFNVGVIGPGSVSLLESRDRYLEDYLNNLGGGMRFATLVVAASDSKDTNKQHADYVCTGSHDEATINAAINALPASGGKVLLMEGHYYCSAILGIAGGQIALKNNVHLEGMGPGTIVQFINGLSVNQATWLVAASSAGGGQPLTYAKVSNIAFNVNYTNNAGVATSIGAVIVNFTTGVTIDNCWVLDGSPSQFAVNIEQASAGAPNFGTRFTNNYLQNGSIQVSGASGDDFSCVVADNVLHGGYIQLNAVSEVTVEGNHLAGQGTGNFGTGVYGIYLFGAARSLIKGNRVSAMKVGVFVDNSSSSLGIEGNHVYFCDQDGIEVSSGSDVSITDNVVNSCGQKAANTYDGIGVDAGASQCAVMNNQVRSTQHHYGINNAGTGITIVNNDLHGGYTTAATHDTGTAIFNLDGSGNNWNRT